MRVFVAGATGAIGLRLVRQLTAVGYEVIGTYHSPEKASLLESLGVESISLDLLNLQAVCSAVVDAKPDAIVHEATALSGAGFSRKLDKAFAATNRLRTDGTDNLLAAARAANVRRFVAQSFAPYRYARSGGMIKTEDDPLDAAPPAGSEQTNAAMAHVDQTVTAFGGVSLRYGGFYGADNDGMIKPVRKRQFPIVGDGAGITPFVHLDDAAAATVLALNENQPGVFNIVDDDPAPMAEWLPVLADALGAKPPRHAPLWLARLVAGEGGVIMGTQARGASNTKAKRQLGWTLRYPTWRQGFRAAYATSQSASQRH